MFSASPPPVALFTLFTSILGALALASVVGFALKLHFLGRRNPTVDNLLGRINAWWGIVLVLGVSFFLDKRAVIAVFGLISFLALREFVSRTHTRRGDHWALAATFFFFLPLQYVLVGMEWYGLYAILIPVYAFLTLPVLAALSTDTSRVFERAARIQFALMICVYCISYLPALMTLHIAGYADRNILLIAWLVLVVQACDVLQPVWSKVGKGHPLAEPLSPDKTVEGLVGGAISAALLGAGLFWITPFQPWQAGAIALVVAVMGSFGDMLMTAMRRRRATLVDRRSGMLDRLDSLIFAAPVYFHLVRYGWEP